MQQTEKPSHLYFAQAQVVSRMREEFENYLESEKSKADEKNERMPLYTAAPPAPTPAVTHGRSDLAPAPKSKMKSNPQIKNIDLELVQLMSF